MTVIPPRTYWPRSPRAGCSSGRSAPRSRRRRSSPDRQLKWLGVWEGKPNTQLIVAPGISSIADLKGKSVGITVPGSLIDLFARRILTDNNVNPSGVHFQSLQSTTALTLSVRGRLDSRRRSSARRSRPMRSSLKGSTSLLDVGSKYSWPQGGLVGYMPWVTSHSAATTQVMEAICGGSQPLPVQPHGSQGGDQGTRAHHQRRRPERLVPVRAQHPGHEHYRSVADDRAVRAQVAVDSLPQQVLQGRAQYGGELHRRHVCPRRRQKVVPIQSVIRRGLRTTQSAPGRKASSHAYRRQRREELRQQRRHLHPGAGRREPDGGDR